MKNTLVLFFSLFLFSAFGQFSKGMMLMEVTGIKMNGDDAPPEMSSMLGNMQVQIISDGLIQKNSMTMMMMKNVTIMDSKLDSVYLYMEVMGKKYLIADHYANSKSGAEQIEANYKTKEFPDDVKEILGFKCKRVDISFKLPSENDSSEVTIKTYVTKEIKFDPAFISQTNRSFKLDGTPMEFNMIMGSGSFQMELQMTAKQFNKDINPADLNHPTGNYKRYTLEEFQKEFSKMGN